jgi:hypothetical protein
VTARICDAFLEELKQVDRERVDLSLEKKLREVFAKSRQHC